MEIHMKPATTSGAALGRRVMDESVLWKLIGRRNAIAEMRRAIYFLPVTPDGQGARSGQCS